MTTVPIEVPPEVEETVREVFGAAGERWLGELPGLVEKLCGTWGLTVIGPAFGGGTHAFVAPVRRGDGSVAVLKVPVVDEENVAEATGLFCYGGDGAVTLYGFDAGSGAMLMEWARPGEPLLAQPGFPSLEGRPENASRVRLACTLLRRLRREPVGVPEDYPTLPTATDMVERWTSRLQHPEPELAEVLPEDLRERALAWCARLAVPAGPLLVVNRDTHLGNIVAAEREPWLLIDPKPYLGEAAFDAGFLIMIQVQSAPTPEHARAVVAATARDLDIPADRANGWAFLRAIEEIIWSVEDEDTEALPLHLAVAHALATSPAS
ncbi:aminoglycoside phosphotransferase family protein [Nocardia rhizosphaerihabitans]|uniref:aminoglycoside phosphotransferase family protein n=1 Tax=Nocardia rhizosphaerihabitans TaxID=1691570 RepID=UPI00166A0D75|nr:aminoglycoside phosphotransferase family protein [Nocardia rhizosphaerihabitans]